MNTKDLTDLIIKHFGRFDTDLLSGFEEGMKGKQRICGKLFSRMAPSHLTGQRYRNWNRGRDVGEQYKSNLCKMTSFYGNGPKGPMVVRRKGWVARAPVITQMERAGAYGVVDVYYTERGEIKRQHECGI